MDGWGREGRSDQGGAGLSVRAASLPAVGKQRPGDQASSPEALQTVRLSPAKAARLPRRLWTRRAAGSPGAW